MIWIIILVIVGYILVRFLNELNKDNNDLGSQNLDQKFSGIVNILNYAAFDGQGFVTIMDKREFNLYQEGRNQIIYFFYGTGTLTITWKYKYLQKEVVHQKMIPNSRNLSLIQQRNIAEGLIREMAEVIEQHKQDVWSEF